LYRTDECLKDKIDKDLEYYFSLPDPLWQHLISQAFGKAKKKFSNEDIACIVFEHQDDLIENENYDSDTYHYIYVCEALLNKQREIENPSIKKQETVTIPDIVPADLSRYPHLKLILAEWIQNNQVLFNLFVEGILKAAKIIKPGYNYRSNWAYLYRVIVDLKIFIINDINQSQYADAISEILQSSDYYDMNGAFSASTIRRNVGENLDIINNRSLTSSGMSKKYYEELVSCFDSKLKTDSSQHSSQTLHNSSQFWADSSQF